MDINDLITACNNGDNAHMLSLTPEKIRNDKVEIINELPLTEEDKIGIIGKLVGYRYIEEIHDIRSGTFLRWISTVDDDNINLTTGGIFCEVVFTDYYTSLRMKNFRNRYFELKLDDVILFQKLTTQEQVLMSALSYVR